MVADAEVSTVPQQRSASVIFSDQLRSVAMFVKS